MRLSRYSLIVAKRKEYCESQVYQRKLKLLKISWLPSSHLFFSLIVVRVNGGPLSLQESSRRPSLAAVRLRSVKQLLILPALQNGLGPDWLMSNFDMWLLFCSLLAQAFDRHFCGTAFNTTESGRCGP